jgi:hypothetical protein
VVGGGPGAVYADLVAEPRVVDETLHDAFRRGRSADIA